MSLWSGLRGLFAAPAPKKAAARPRQKTVLPPSERSALIKQALAAHRTGRAHVRDALEAQLGELRAKIPKPGKDPQATERLLTLHHAHGTVKKLMTHDLKRFLVLVGIRELLGEQDRPSPPKSSSRP